MSPPRHPDSSVPPIATSHAESPTRADLDAEDTTCPRCGESQHLAKVKGCIKCLKCSFKFDCNGW